MNNELETSAQKPLIPKYEPVRGGREQRFTIKLGHGQINRLHSSTQAIACVCACTYTPLPPHQPMLPSSKQPNAHSSQDSVSLTYTYAQSSKQDVHLFWGVFLEGSWQT